MVYSRATSLPGGVDASMIKVPQRIESSRLTIKQRLDGNLVRSIQYYAKKNKRLFGYLSENRHQIKDDGKDTRMSEQQRNRNEIWSQGCRAYPFKDSDPVQLPQKNNWF
jgi:hypothetical protein